MLLQASSFKLPARCFVGSNYVVIGLVTPSTSAAACYHEIIIRRVDSDSCVTRTLLKDSNTDGSEVSMWLEAGYITCNLNVEAD